MPHLLGRRAVSTALLAGLLLFGACGGEEEPDAAADEAAIRGVLVENEIGGPERCEEIYTDAYLEENWNEDVTAYPGDTPIEKCQSQPPLPGVTEADVAVTIDGLEGDAATATSKVRASPGVGFTLIRSGDAWQIDGFAE